MKPWSVTALLAVAGSLAVSLSNPALAVAPAGWDHATEPDFAPGKFVSTVVSSSGQVRLSHRITILMSSGRAPSAVSALAADGKTLYAASGVGREVYKIVGSKATLLAKPPGAVVTSLCWTGKELLAGTGGRGAGVYAINAAGKVTPRWRDPAVQYVWAILPGPDGRIFVATGPGAAVYALSPDGTAARIYHAPKPAKNILCLAQGRGGLLYAGTDAGGLVVEIHSTSGASRVLFDAEEQEISCLLAAESGEVYAATSQASRADQRDKHAAGRAVSVAASQPADEDEAAEDAPSDGDPDESPDDPEAAGTKPAAIPTAEAEEPTDGEEPETPAVHGTAAPAAGEASGNAVYRIDPDGLVRPIFRKRVTVLSMICVDRQIILGTGNGGALYAVSPDGQELTQLAVTDAKQVTALAAAADGRIVFGTSNKGAVGTLGAGLADKGTYTSKVLDAAQIARWGAAHVRLSAPGPVTFATRSGNLAKADDATWSPWSAEQPATDGFLQVASPAGRFLQYRLTLSAAGPSTPAVRQVEVLYQVGNLPPVVSQVTAKPSTAPREGRAQPGSPQAYRHIAFTATDANDDTLVFTVAFRQAGSAEWVTLADKLDQPRYVWDTRTVGDGVYELQVTADDSPANPPGSSLSTSRVSAPLIVDNKPPLVVALGATAAKGVVKVTGTADDAGSRIAGIHYAVDSQEDWVAVLPADGIADSSREDFTFTLKDLPPGPHRLAVKVTDLFDNAGYGTLSVTAAGPASSPAASAPSASKPAGD